MDTKKTITIVKITPREYPYTKFGSIAYTLNIAIRPNNIKGIKAIEDSPLLYNRRPVRMVSFLKKCISITINEITVSDIYITDTILLIILISFISTPTC